MSLKLGKLAPKHPKGMLMMSRFLSPELPAPPSKIYREYKIPNDVYGMYANDTIGDCTCAEVAHHLMIVTAHAGKLVVPELADVIAMYSAITGYDPRQTDSAGNNPTDTGAAITDVLTYWQHTGLAGHKILGWAQIDHTSALRRAQGVWLFGGLSVGVQLPAIAQDQFGAGQNWELVDDDGGIAGGHCIIQTGYGRNGENYGTWGKGDQKAGRGWTDRYVDETYCVFTDEWIEEASGLAPNGFNASALQADLKAISV